MHSIDRFFFLSVDIRSLPPQCSEEGRKPAILCLYPFIQFLSRAVGVRYFRGTNPLFLIFPPPLLSFRLSPFSPDDVLSSHKHGTASFPSLLSTSVLFRNPSPGCPLVKGSLPCSPIFHWPHNVFSMFLDISPVISGGTGAFKSSIPMGFLDL